MEHTLEPAGLPEAAALPHVRTVGLLQPIVWLRHGARDLAHAPGAGLTLGGAVSLAGLVLAALAWKATYLAPALLGGFLLVAPFIAVALYVVSRQLEQGEAPDTGKAWKAWRGNASSIAMFGLMLALAYIFWERLAAIVFALFYAGEAMHPSLLWEGVLSGRYLGFLATFLGAGAVLAAAVYAMGVVSAPLLVDRPVDVITAVLTSVRCCLRNPGPMLLWAVLIAALTALGFATLMLGLVVVFPWLAHASWHAYRDLVEPPETVG